MKNKILYGLAVISISVMLTGCHMSHTWLEATCTEPKTCSECGKTEGEVSGHTWLEATCTEPKTYSECGKIEGAALGHTWLEATCTEPKTCSTCGETEGEIGHVWVEASYTKPKTCSECGETEGEPLLSYVQENGIEFTQGTSFTTKGIRYNKDTPEDYEVIDQNVNITSITIEDAETEGYQIVTMESTNSGYIFDSADGVSRHTIRLSFLSPFDIYTGKVIPPAHTSEDMQISHSMELEWEGSTYSIEYREDTHWEQGEWVIESGGRSATKLMTCFKTDTFIIPKGYDGLAVRLWAQDEYTEREVGVVDETERYIMDVWKEGDRLIRISELYEALNN